MTRPLHQVPPEPADEIAQAATEPANDLGEQRPVIIRNELIGIVPSMALAVVGTALGQIRSGEVVGVVATFDDPATVNA